MLGWAIAFVMAAIIVEFLGVVETTHTFAILTKVLFWVFVIGFIVSMTMHYKANKGRGAHRES